MHKSKVDTGSKRQERKILISLTEIDSFLNNFPSTRISIIFWQSGKKCMLLACEHSRFCGAAKESVQIIGSNYMKHFATLRVEEWKRRRAKNVEVICVSFYRKILDNIQQR